MSVVVDTSVVAYLVLRTGPFVEEVEQFWRSVTDPIAPASWAAELANVLWMAVRHRIVDAEEAVRRLSLVDRLGIRSVSVRALWRGALARASASGVTAYDALFVELAVRRGVALVTYDAGVLSRFPEVARRPGRRH